MKVVVCLLACLHVILAFSGDRVYDEMRRPPHRHGNHPHVENHSIHHKAKPEKSPGKDTEKRIIFDGQTYVRLQHGTSAHDGRVEYFAVGVWGTICDQDWTNADASVVCHMLGFPRTGATARLTGNGFGHGIVMLDHVHCTGTEASLEECPSGRIGTSNCSHFHDAGVVCDNSTKPDNFLLFTDSTSRVIFRMDLTTNSYVLMPLRRSGNPIAIDYDPVGGRVYWTDVVVKEIHSMTIDAQDQNIIRRLGNNSVADGLAVDPISRLIIYTDAGRDIIAVMKMDGTIEKTVVSSGLDQPRDIEVDPLNGVMYWSDWGSSPKIEKANYDGTSRQSVISTGLGFPNAIALDISGNKIYWADAKTDKIEVANLDGSSRRVIYNQPLSHEFGLTLYGNFLYFTDWTKTAVMRVSTTGGSAGPVGPPGFGRLNDIKVHKNGVGPSGTNGCSNNNGGCNGICIPTANRGSKCL